MLALLEMLESRRLLCGSVTRLLADGTLVVNGTKKNDDIAVSRDATSFIVTQNGKSKSFDATLVKVIKLMGGKGDDFLHASEATGPLGIPMLISGGQGKDTLIGGSGADTVLGGAGDDQMFGSEGDDSMMGGAGNDAMTGEDGNDVMRGQKGDDALFGSGGNDSLCGGCGNDSLAGEFDNDYLSGEAGNDNLDGGDGDDELVGGKGKDVLRGGDGVDTFHSKDLATERADTAEIIVDDSVKPT